MSAFSKITRPARVGLISDTHGKLDPSVHDVFKGVDAILHAGDVCSPHLLDELYVIAPVAACQGNCDGPQYGTQDLPFVVDTTIAGVRFLVVHDFAALGEAPDNVDVVVCGHTHKVRNEWHGRTLVLNPGSPSQSRNHSGHHVGILEIAEDGALNFKDIELSSG